jgi:hypothetical protein
VVPSLRLVVLALIFAGAFVCLAANFLRWPGL